jgi:hypothetical protein
MEKSIIKKEIQILLEAIQEQYEIISEYPDFIPKIEFDMIMENVRKLYEAFHRLQRLNDPMTFIEKKPVPETPDHQPPTTNHQPPTTDHQPPSPDHQPLTTNHQPPTTDHQPPTAVKKAQRKARISDPELFPAEEPAFNSRLKEAREKSLGPKVSRHESLKASIGINDKFMFINDLFDGNLRGYNEFIEKLGSFTTLQQALEFLEQTMRKNDWNRASHALARLQEILAGRF